MRGCGLAGGAGALCINGRNVPSIAVAHSAALVSCGLSTTVTAGYMYRVIVLHVLLSYTFYCPTATHVPSVACGLSCHGSEYTLNAEHPSQAGGGGFLPSLGSRRLRRQG